MGSQTLDATYWMGRQRAWEMALQPLFYRIALLGAVDGWLQIKGVLRPGHEPPGHKALWKRVATTDPGGTPLALIPPPTPVQPVKPPEPGEGISSWDVAAPPFGLLGAATLEEMGIEDWGWVVENQPQIAEAPVPQVLASYLHANLQEWSSDHAKESAKRVVETSKSWVEDKLNEWLGLQVQHYPKPSIDFSGFGISHGEGEGGGGEGEGGEKPEKPEKPEREAGGEGEKPEKPTLDEFELHAHAMFNLNRTQSITTTEYTNAYVHGLLQAYHGSGQVQGKVFRTSEDERVCTICGPHDGEIIDLGESFEAGDTGFDGPPLHVRCRCFLEPILINVQLGGEGE